MDFKELLASYARQNAEEIMSHIGPNTPFEHTVTLVAIAESWNNFAKMLEL